ncbi:MAG: hypothetical protein NQ127_01830 [Candidatus Cardinium sp.]|nr:hypothetical protein [Candidatus Cardinium sp.]
MLTSLYAVLFSCRVVHRSYFLLGIYLLRFSYLLDINYLIACAVYAAKDPGFGCKQICAWSTILYTLTYGMPLQTNYSHLSIISFVVRLFIWTIVVIIA